MSNAAGGTGSTTAAATMKLLVETASQRVLFAEAGKDVVDFLFGVLATPVGGVASLLRAEDAADALGSVVNVYASAEKMDAAYMQGAEARDALVVNDSIMSGPSLRLVPASRSAPSAAPPAGPGPGPAPAYPTYYDPYTPVPMSSSYWAAPLPAGAAPAPAPAPYGWYPPPPAAAAAPQQPVDLLPPPSESDDDDGALLPPSLLYRCHACHALGSTQGSRGFVQPVATYTVMDDLTVAPASNLSTVALLGRIGVKDLAALEEKTVTVGRQECLAILRESLRSKTVLTDVFLAKTKKRARSAGDNSNEGAASE